MSESLAVKMQLIDADLDNELDLVNVETILRNSLMTSTIEEQATIVGRRPTFKHLFVNFSRQLCDGITLDLEALIDVLTLKDNIGESAVDAATALDRLYKDTVRLQSLHRGLAR